MSHHRLHHLASAAATAGGLAWLAKIAVIAGTDGRVTSTGAAAVCFLAGLALLAVGGAALTLPLARRGGRIATAGALVLAPVVFWASFTALDPAAQAVAGDAGPAWLADEVGIAVTGAAWLIVGLLGLRGRPLVRPVQQAAG